MTLKRSTMVPNASGTNIGDTMQTADLGASITKINGEVWGRSGVFFNPATYTTAATIDYLKAVGNASTQTTSYGSVGYGDIATDGSGRWVIAYGDATNVLVSTDNGATFTAVAHSIGGGALCTSVCFDSTNNVFIAAGNSSTQFYVSSVAPASVGSAWTVRGGMAITSGTASTAKVRSSGGVSVIVCGAGTTGNASRSTNGTTWSAVNLAVALSSSLGASGVEYVGSNIWLTRADNNSSSNRSTDNGATFSSVTYPANFVGIAKNSSIILAVDTNSNFYTSTTGATGSWTSLGKLMGAGYAVFQAVGGSLWTDGTNFYCSISSGYAANYAVDGRIAVINSTATSVKIRSVIGRSWADGTTSAVKQVLGVYTNGDFVLAPMVSNTGAVYGNFSTTTGVGIPVATSSPSSAISPPPTTYVRIA